MTTNDTCPYCGAEKEFGTDNFDCGNSYEATYSDSQVDRTIYCYELQIGHLQARIDELMFEYCPDEMTKEQIERYTNAQRIVEE